MNSPSTQSPRSRLRWRTRDSSDATVGRRRTWIVDSDPLELEFLADTIEEAAEGPSTLVPADGLRPRFEHGFIPDALLVDAPVLMASGAPDPDVTPMLDLVDRLAVICARPSAAVEALSQRLPHARMLWRPLTDEQVTGVVSWLNRFTDDESWASRRRPMAVGPGPTPSPHPAGPLDAPAPTLFRSPVPASGSAERDWERTGQWSPETQ